MIRRLQRGEAVVLMCLLATLGIAGSSLAERPFRGMQRDPGGFIERAVEELGLDDETSRAVRAVADESRQRGEELRKNVRKARRAMRDLLEQDQVDEDVVMAQADQIAALEAEASKHRLSTILRIRALLTPEQRSKMMSMHEARRERRRDRVADRLEESCGNAIDSYCGEAEPGFETMACLRDHRDEIAPTCRDAIAHRRPHRGPGKGSSD